MTTYQHSLSVYIRNTLHSSRPEQIQFHFLIHRSYSCHIQKSITKFWSFDPPIINVSYSKEQNYNRLLLPEAWTPRFAACVLRYLPPMMMMMMIVIMTMMVTMIKRKKSAIMTIKMLTMTMILIFNCCNKKLGNGCWLHWCWPPRCEKEKSPKMYILCKNSQLISRRTGFQI